MIADAEIEAPPPARVVILCKLICAKGHVHNVARGQDNERERELSDEVWRLRKRAEGAYLWEDDRPEAVKSLLHATGGVASLGVGWLLTPATTVAPTIGRAVLQVFAVGATGQIVGNGGEMAVDWVTNPQLRHASRSEIEEQFYQRVGKDIPFVGAVYSFGRAGVAYQQGHASEAKQCLKNGGINFLVSTVATVLVHWCNTKRHQAATAPEAAQTNAPSPSGIEESKVGETAVKTESQEAIKSYAEVAKPGTDARVESTIKSGTESITSCSTTESTAEAGVTTATSSIAESTGIAKQAATIKSGIAKGTQGATKSTFKRIVTLPGKTIKKLPTSQLFKSVLAGCTPVTSNGIQSLTVGKQDAIFNGTLEACEDLFIQCLQTLDLYPHEAEGQMGYFKFIVDCLCLDFGERCRGPNGESPLVLATRAGNIPAMQAILAFSPSCCGEDAIYELIDGMGSEQSWMLPKYILQKVYTSARVPFPPHLENQECLKPFKVIHTDVPHFLPRDIQANNNRGLKILCIDGGGVRGLIALELLNNIMRPIGEDQSPREHFDWIAGTSTGGILALYFALGHTVAECRKLYFALKDQVFQGSCPRNTAALEQVLKDTFGEETKMSDIQGIKILITATTGSIGNFRIVTFSNVDERTQDWRIWQVARCTSAAPSFFEPFKCPNGILYYDGGLAANNPTWPLLNKLVDENLENATIVSIGCGRPYNNPARITFARCSEIPAAVGQLLDLLIDGISESDGVPVTSAMTHCARTNTFFYRLNPYLPKLPHLAEIQNIRLVNAIWHAQAYATQHRRIFDQITRRIITT